MNEFVTISIEQLAAIMPHAQPRRIVAFCEPLNDAMQEFGIDTPARQAAFLSQVAHESGSLRYTLELASGHAYDSRADLGNTRPEAIEAAKRNDTTPGAFYKGRGLIQITGYDNYAACSLALFGNREALTQMPVILERKELAARSAAWFWSSRGLNGLADAGNFERITRRINGGLNGYADRVAYHNRAKEILQC